MNTILKTIALGASLSLTLPVLTQAESYTIDPSHSFVKFETSHLGVSKLSGRFNTIAGKLKYDPAVGEESQSVEVSIDTTSLDTNWADRDKHLRSGDFFNVAKFSNATFKSTKFSGDASGGTLTGILTFLGVSKNIDFPIKKIEVHAEVFTCHLVGSFKSDAITAPWIFTFSNFLDRELYGFTDT